MATDTVCVRIAQLTVAIENCRKTGNVEWEAAHTGRIEDFVESHMPHGSGFDCGTQFDFGKSRRDRLVFNTAYHHMNYNGMYDGWTEHQVIVTPSLAFGFNLRVTGRDRSDIKDYIGEEFQTALDELDEEVT